MLGALIVMGLLTVGTIKTYRKIVNNTKVQNTAKMIQTLVLERQNSAISSSTGSRSRWEGPHGDVFLENGSVGKFKNYFWIETDSLDEDFCEGLKASDMIKADVVEGTCPGKITFYFPKNVFDEVSGVYTDNDGYKHFCPEHAITCEDENTPTSCEDGYLLDDEGCVACPEEDPTCERTCRTGQTYDEVREKCVQACNASTELTCSNETDVWCCGDGLICDYENQTCKDGGGACQYSFSQQEQTISANCHYRVSAQTQIIAANCHYTILDHDDGGGLHHITMTEDQNAKCEPDEYCYIGYFDETCTSTINRGNIGASGVEDVWGTCLKRTSNNGTCNVSSYTTNFMEEDRDAKCQPDEYCYIGYFDETCTSTINRGDVGSSQTEDVWGTCLKRTSNNGSCNISEISAGGLTEGQGCPAGQYCYINWEGTNCSTPINRGDVTGPLFGACIDRTSNTVDQCPI